MRKPLIINLWGLTGVDKTSLVNIRLMIYTLTLEKLLASKLDDMQAITAVHESGHAEIVNRIAMLLGGFAAEKLVFGDENVTTGAVSDIHKATHFACHMLKNCGMGEVPASFHQEDAMTKYYLFDSDFSVNDQIRRLIPLQSPLPFFSHSPLLIGHAILRSCGPAV